MLRQAWSSLCATTALLALLPVSGCGPAAVPEPASSPPGYAQQAEQFPREIIKVADGVHVAVGFGLANSVLIEGEAGNIIVDTLESAEAAVPLRQEFQKISSAPLAAIVYTHNHADHIFGAGELARGSKPEVFAHASFQAELDRIVNVTRPIAWRRAMRQFGVMLPDADRTHCGIGPRLLNDASSTLSPLLPTRTFDGERLDVTVAGVHMELLHLPGETPDHVAVWLPERRVLVAGDNYYHSFPNLYAIRGTANRDVLEWARSVDRMRELRPEYLVPCHTLPVRGEQEIRRRLTDYGDAIQFVHDQTVRAMNEGLEPEQIVESVRLPAALASQPWLAERYGRVDWSVRAIFDGYLGWFGGDAAELSPLGRKARAERIATLAGGSEKLRDATTAALKAGDLRWALELSGHLRALGEFTEVAAQVRAAALRGLAASEASANGRNYYLTQALETEQKLAIDAPEPSRLDDGLLASIPVGNFLRAMTVRLDPAKAEGKSLAVGFRFTDIGEDWGMRLRNGIVELEQRLPEGADMTVSVDSKIWKEILTRKRNATAAFASGAVQVDRNRLELVRFLFLFR